MTKRNLFFAPYFPFDNSAYNFFFMINDISAS